MDAGARRSWREKIGELGEMEGDGGRFGEIEGDRRCSEAGGRWSDLVCAHCSWKVSPNILPSTVIDALPCGPRSSAMLSTKLFCHEPDPSGLGTRNRMSLFSPPAPAAGERGSEGCKARDSSVPSPFSRFSLLLPSPCPVGLFKGWG